MNPSGPSAPVLASPRAALELLSPATRDWFSGALGDPTAAQAGAWQAIREARDTLVIAPTGSGKTLAAFLMAIDALMFPEPEAPARGPGVSVLYLSPLKALGADVERNLTSPLVGTRRSAERMGVAARPVRVGMRTGDTPAAERRALVSNPPDILITTPESLFLMLSSSARESLTTVRTVIVDEVHAVAGSKRGVHLALSLARLDALTDSPAQRIGLSATVEPVREVAGFLGGADRQVAVVRPPATKELDLTVRLPITDFEAIEPPADAADEDDVAGTIWPHIERAILEEVLSRRSTIVFTNSRRQAERLTGRLNLLHRRREAAAAGLAAPGPASWAVGRTDGTEDPSLAADGEVEDVARAHHGSMSKEHRRLIEEQLKSGELRCVVATSSLELGIDMGSVDLVIQVETPPAISSMLQRIGRAGHDVGAVSRGIVHPLHAADVLRAAVTVRESLAGRIEPLVVPRNALDVLAQHTVSAAAVEPLELEEWFGTVRSAHPYAALPRSLFDGTIDLLCGRYPSTAFSELRPRLVLDRETGILTARPGAQRLAVTSGGTIPDRGLFPVFLVAGEDSGQARRVGELDEEMVYESRRGDVITLGTSSWRIEEITHDRVTVSPAFGLAGRIPFWHGEGAGRPVELGRALGGFEHEISSRAPEEALAQLAEIGLDQNSRHAALRFLQEQQQATGTVPGPESLVIERFLDELGDWRVVLHCALGQRVTAPWALAVGARVQDRFGLDGQVMAADDGIVLRIPHGEEAPGADLFVFTPEEIDEEVRRLVGTSALFASRFRECAARALLLPRRDPGSRAPLWQQRQRAAALLDVARPYPDFPIMLEAARECLQDVYDLPSLVAVMQGITTRQVQVREVETPAPSPFARSLLFGYVAQFLYDGDAPAAEKRSAALALDQSLLAELLGTVSLRELLDPAAIAQVSQQLQGLTPERALRGAEDLADALRRLGPLAPEQIEARMAEGASAAEASEELLAARRAVAVRIGGAEQLAAIEDAGLLRDALGIALPVGVPAVHLEPVPRPVEELLSRWARARGPFTLEEAVRAHGLAPGVARTALESLVADRALTTGEFTPGGEGVEWVEAEVLRRIRRASLAASRREIEPVAPSSYARFLGGWQHVRERDADGAPRRSSLAGADGALSVIDQLAGVSLPLSTWESQVLPARLHDASSALLDGLFASGEIVWTGHGRLGSDDGWVRLHLADALPLGLDAATIEDAADALAPGSVASRVLALLRGSPGALRHTEILRALAADPEGGGAVDPPQLTEALWELAFSTLITNDSFAPLRGYAMGPARSSRPSRGRGRARPATRRGAARLSAAMLRAGAAHVSELETGPAGSGRWSALRVPMVDATARASALAALLLDRHGVLTRGGMGIEDVPGSFATMYRVLQTLEENGGARRGYFIDGLGAAQFAPPGAVDRLRDRDREREAAQARRQDGDESGRDDALAVLAATDPANPYGAALPWPDPGVQPPEGTSLRPARRAGSLVVLDGGEVAAVLERGGKSLLWYASPVRTPHTARALAHAVAAESMIPALAVERISGHGIESEAVAHVAAALAEAGCYRSPRAIRLRAGGR
ncbi:ATP-dependent helicase [Brachybacterium hainanense]|uniref:ATP-dependent helicase n=1 Tax=Brachybacterium hainanense TaxID=1541174 RepID=A0ABV6R905_9MICO